MKKITYTVKGMDCAECARKVEKGVSQLPGVQLAQVEFATGQMHIQGEADVELIEKRVEALGYSLAADRNNAADQRSAGFWRYLFSRPEIRPTLIGLLLFLLSFATGLFGTPDNFVLPIQASALAVAGFPIARKGIANLRFNRDFDINLLMTIAAIGAVILGETAEAAALILLFTLAEALEGYTSDQARRVLGEMSSLVPATAIRLTGTWEEVVPVEQLRVGDEIVTQPGQRIPMDGVVTAGASAVNQAPITGESIPVEKAQGDEVFAGTVNGSGSLSIRVTRLASDTTIQRIIRMIEDAQSMRAPTQRFIDRFARVYTPLMVLAAVLVASVPPVLFGQPFFNQPGETGWLYRALTLLVIACPCALVISAPVTIVSAITSAARRGILIKGGAYLEALSEVKVFAFDKTGTLTQGQPVITAYRSIDCSDKQHMPNGSCPTCDEVLALASALERRSAHPLAHSVISAAIQRELIERYPAADDVTAIAGSGLQGRVNGHLATIGSHKLFDEHHPHQKNLCSWVDEAESQGQTAMLICDGSRVRGYLAAADAIRPASAEAVAKLKQLGKETALLTGDNAIVARRVGEQIQIDHIEAGLLPEEKVQAVQRLSARYGSTAMVGDGINDTPALAAASLGIAMGGAGSAQAMETADIVLMASDLSQLPFAVRLSLFARRLIQQNIVISLGTKLAFVILALAGITPLWLAVLADVGVSLVVTANGMRAQRLSG